MNPERKLAILRAILQATETEAEAIIKAKEATKTTLRQQLESVLASNPVEIESAKAILSEALTQ